MLQLNPLAYEAASFMRMLQLVLSHATASCNEAASFPRMLQPRPLACNGLMLQPHPRAGLGAQYRSLVGLWRRGCMLDVFEGR